MYLSTYLLHPFTYCTLYADFFSLLYSYLFTCYALYADLLCNQPPIGFASLVKGEVRPIRLQRRGRPDIFIRLQRH